MRDRPWRRQLGLDPGIDEIVQDVDTRSPEILGQAGRHGRADAHDLLEAVRPLARGLGQVAGCPLEPATAAAHRLALARRQFGRQPGRQVDRRGPADLRDPERRDDPLQWSAP